MVDPRSYVDYGDTHKPSQSHLSRKHEDEPKAPSRHKGRPRLGDRLCRAGREDDGASVTQFQQ